MTSHQSWFETPELEHAYQLLEALLSDTEVQQLLRVNRYQDVLWFDKHAFDRLLWWMLTVAVVSLSAGTGTARRRSGNDRRGAPHDHAAARRRRSIGLPGREAAGDGARVSVGDALQIGFRLTFREAFIVVATSVRCFSYWLCRRSRIGLAAGYFYSSPQICSSRSISARSAVSSPRSWSRSAQVR